MCMLTHTHTQARTYAHRLSLSLTQKSFLPSFLGEEELSSMLIGWPLYQPPTIFLITQGSFWSLKILMKTLKWLNCTKTIAAFLMYIMCGSIRFNPQTVCMQWKQGWGGQKVHLAETYSCCYFQVYLYAAKESNLWHQLPEADTISCHLYVFAHRLHLESSTFVQAVHTHDKINTH